MLQIYHVTDTQKSVALMKTLDGHLYMFTVKQKKETLNAAECVSQ